MTIAVPKTKYISQTLQTDGSVLIQIQGAAIFSNFLFLKETLADRGKRENDYL